MEHKEGVKQTCRKLAILSSERPRPLSTIIELTIQYVQLAARRRAPWRRLTEHLADEATAVTGPDSVAIAWSHSARPRRSTKRCVGEVAGWMMPPTRSAWSLATSCCLGRDRGNRSPLSIWSMVLASGDPADGRNIFRLSPMICSEDSR
jgi:hypothetical protein